MVFPTEVNFTGGGSANQVLYPGRWGPMAEPDVGTEGVGHATRKAEALGLARRLRNWWGRRNSEG